LYYEAPSGGQDYAYVWHRDLFEIGLALVQAGQLDIVNMLSYIFRFNQDFEGYPDARVFRDFQAERDA